MNEQMDLMIQQQSFALEMEVLSERMQRLEMEDKMVTLLNELWDKMCMSTTAHRTVGITCEEDGMEFVVGKLLVPRFYFMNKKKFCYGFSIFGSHKYNQNIG